MDLIKHLLEYDLIEIIYNIFSHLDGKSLTNCRVVCQDWKQFIDYQFNEFPKGQKCLQQKLITNLLDDTYEPKEITVHFIEEIYCIQADKDSVCVSTKFGNVSNYKFHTLEHLWTSKVCDQISQICMNTDRVFVGTSDTNCNYEGNIFIIDRATGQLLCEFLDAHSHPICGVRVFENVLATADYWGFIKFHEINTYNPVLIYEENRYHEGGFKHLQHDKDKLVSRQ